MMEKSHESFYHPKTEKTWGTWTLSHRWIHILWNWHKLYMITIVITIADSIKIHIEYFVGRDFWSLYIKYYKEYIKNMDPPHHRIFLNYHIFKIHKLLWYAWINRPIFFFFFVVVVSTLNIFSFYLTQLKTHNGVSNHYGYNKIKHINWILKHLN